MFCRLVRPLILFFLLLRYKRQNMRALHKYGQICAEVFGGLEAIPRATSSVSLHDFASVFGAEHGSLAMVEDRQLDALYRRILPLEPKRNSTPLALTSDLAIRAERVVVARVFQKQLGLGLGAQELDVLQQYRTPALALLDFLEYCGCPNASPRLMPLDVELKCFVLWARKPLQKVQATQGIGSVTVPSGLSARMRLELEKLRTTYATWRYDPRMATGKDHGILWQTLRKSRPTGEPLSDAAVRAAKLALVMHVDACRIAFAIDSAVEAAQTQGQITLDPPTSDVIQDLDRNRDDFLAAVWTWEDSLALLRHRARVLRQADE